VIGRPLTPGSVAGVNRRVHRRAYRHGYYGYGGYGYGTYRRSYGYGYAYRPYHRGYYRGYRYWMAVARIVRSREQVRKLAPRAHRRDDISDCHYANRDRTRTSICTTRVAKRAATAALGSVGTRREFGPHVFPDAGGIRSSFTLTGDHGRRDREWESTSGLLGAAREDSGEPHQIRLVRKRLPRSIPCWAGWRAARLFDNSLPGRRVARYQLI